MQKSRAIIVDLDGTLYDAKERQEKYLLSGKKDFDGFHKAAKNDKPNLWCAQTIKAMKNCGYRIVFTSGRDDTYRSETEDWLKFHFLWKPIEDYMLFMRPAGDYTPDDAMKKEWFVNHISPAYDVLYCIDDRKRVADMWRSLGLTCLHCAEGFF